MTYDTSFDVDDPNPWGSASEQPARGNLPAGIDADRNVDQQVQKWACIVYDVPRLKTYHLLRSGKVISDQRLSLRLGFRRGPVRLTVPQEQATPPDTIAFSENTVALVIEGILNVVSIPETPQVELMLDGRLATERVSGFIRNKVILALIGLADLFRQSDVRSYVLTGNDGFEDRIDSYILSGIPMLLKKAAALSRSLSNDLTSHLSKGGQIAGSWGSINLVGRSLHLKVHGAPSVMPPRGKRPDILEND